jgi:hypothetical protein
MVGVKKRCSRKKWVKKSDKKPVKLKEGPQLVKSGWVVKGPCVII